MMNLARDIAMNDHRPIKPGLRDAALRDYDSVRRAIGFMHGQWKDQPSIDDVADAASVTPDELHHLFRRWAGLTPNAFMQALTLDHAKMLLRDSASILECTDIWRPRRRGRARLSCLPELSGRQAGSARHRRYTVAAAAKRHRSRGPDRGPKGG